LPVPDLIDPLLLRAALGLIPPAAWSLPSHYRDTRVHHGYRRVPLISDGYRHRHAEHFAVVLEAFEPVVGAWLSALDPGGFITPHRDAGPWWQRWHVPIEVAGRVTFGGVTFVPTPGRPFPAAHWEPHWLINDTARWRVSLVIDRRHAVDRPLGPFVREPVPAELEPLIERTRDAPTAP
jgi:hypothetical protein